ncbi:MAG: S9 family peptidase [Ignavibacteriae bacterium]|nr:S9 family peptidase [Ignavibacteriota bacterium]NOG98668.1 S9 family peptidase [Ignavibacteriota bacterium]
MKKITITISSILLFFISSLAGDLDRTHDITIVDYFTQSYISKCEASPNGKFAAFNKLDWDKEIDGRNSDIFLINLDTKDIKQLTTSKQNETDPQWNNDGELLYFIGRYKEKDNNSPGGDGSKQVWSIKVDEDDLNQITDVKGGIEDYKISADGKFLFYTIHKDHMINEWKELRKEFEADLKFGHGIHKITELWKLDLSNGKKTKVYNKIRYIRYFEISPDGKYAALITDPDEKLITHEGQSNVEILNIETGKVQTLEDKLWRADAPSPYGWLSSPAWSSSSKKLAFQISFDGYPSEIFSADVSEKSIQIKKLKRPNLAYVNGDLNWKPNSNELCFLGDYKARKYVFSVNAIEESDDVLTIGDIAIDDFDFIGSSANILAVQSGTDYAGDLFLHNSKKESERLTKLNPQVDTWKLPQMSIFKWAGANGDTVEGILELPPDYNGDEKLPLIVQIHGGPTSAEKFAFRFWIYGRTAFATKGYAVLSPNYRGSTGFGDKFLTELVGRENDIEVTDILTGVDALIEKGIVDKNRLGVMGWSNGGYLTNCLIATNRFKAASSGAGVIDQTMQWGEEDTPGHVINFMEALPWENPQEFIRASPLYSFSKDIKTATIIHVGEDDARVPATHSKTLHRALKHYIKAPTELIIYPGAAHSVTTYKHRLAKMMWDHAWFDKYLPADELKIKSNLEEKK